MNMRRLARPSATFPVVCILVSAGACGDGREATLERAPASIEVRVAKTAVQPLVQTFDAGGIVKARTTAQIASRIVAELQEMRAQPGDRVRQGQILAVLDDREPDARRSEAQALLAAAESATASAAADPICVGNWHVPKQDCRTPGPGEGGYDKWAKEQTEFAARRLW